MYRTCKITILIASLAVFTGCGPERATPDAQPLDQSLSSTTENAATNPADPESTAQQDATEHVDTAPIDETPPDTHFMLDRLRESVSSSEWSIAKSPLTWSTFTADVGDSFSPDTASIVWQKWTTVPTAITLKANTKIKDEIHAAVTAAKPGERPVEREFDFNGFRFVVTASDGDSADTTFVRLSFTDSRYAN
jgi:hypothetical protein